MTRGRVLGVVLGVALVAAPASADWLVMKDGSKVETRGTWEQRGAMLVFYLPSGTLTSVRASEADLAASVAETARVAAAAAAAASTPPPPPPPKREAVITITDADVAHVTDEGEAAADDAGGEPALEIEPAGEGAGAADGPADAGAEEGAGAAANDGTADGQPAAPAAAAAPPAERLQVVQHRRDEGTEHVTLVGEIANVSGDVVSNIVVTAMLRDADGALLATVDAMLGAAILQPGQRTNFRASFPGVTEYARVTFETTHVALRTTAPPAG